jgi:hypothetical protein
VSRHAPTRVGVLGSPHQALVDAAGSIEPDGTGWQVDWWIGADDHWHVPGAGTPTRQHLLDGAPVVNTVLRVPGGDAVERVYGVGGSSGVLAIEIENASPAPFVVALVLRPTDHGAVRSLAANGAWVSIDGKPVLRTVQRARRWAVAHHGGLFDIVAAGAAPGGAFPLTRDRAGDLAAAFLHPVAHRTTFRALVALALDPTAPPEASDPLALPAAGQAALGWRAQLDRGMQVSLPDERLQAAIDAARGAVLLGASTRARATAAKLIALEDWGFDTEASTMWRQLGLRDRRRAAQRDDVPRPWDLVRERLASASPTLTWPDGPGPLLAAVRALLLAEQEDGSVDLLTELPVAWAGQSLEVHDAPTRRGSVSFAVRWHGARPALLWHASGVPELRCPALDASWSTTAPEGETLLEAPTALRP